MRRKVLLVLLVLLLLAPAAFAQSYWGAKIGINAASLIGEDSDAADFQASSKGARAGFVGGAFFSFRLSEMFGVRPELLFSGKGAKYEYDADNGDNKIKVQTIEAPVLLEFFLPIPTEAVDVSVFAGPAVAFITAIKYEYSGDSGDEEGDIEDAGLGIEKNDIDLSIAFGSAVSFGAGPGMVLIDLRYNLGLLTVVDGAGDPELKTGTFGISVGYGFPF